MNRLNDNPDLFSALFEMLEDAAYIMTPEGAIIDCNRAALSAAGRSKNEILSAGIVGLFPEDMAMYLKTLSLQDNGAVLSVELSCCGNDCASFPAKVSMRRLHREDSEAILVIVSDRSEHKRTDEEIRRLTKELNHARKMETIGRLAGGVTHYYNNIFTGLMGAIDIAKQEASADILPLLKRAENAANTASGFTRRLLSFTRTSEEAPAPTDIGSLIDDVEQFARLTFDRRITISIERQSDIDCVLADSAELHHMLLNLMVNARDALMEKAECMPADPHLNILLKAENTYMDNPVCSGETGHAGRIVRITISDNGIGMDDTTKKRLFEPFYTTKEPGKGSGIGLSSTFATVNNAGGRIEVESERGKGTTLTICLPAATMRRTSVSKQDAAELPRGTETVMIVDDDEMIRTLGAMTLERLGYTVIAAADGLEAVDKFIACRAAVDLVVLDLFLPGLSGQQVLEKMRQIKPGVPVIITSGHDFERDKGIFAKLKADDYVLKPFTIADLAMSVRTALDRR